MANEEVIVRLVLVASVGIPMAILAWMVQGVRNIVKDMQGDRQIERHDLRETIAYVHFMMRNDGDKHAYEELVAIMRKYGIPELKMVEHCPDTSAVDLSGMRGGGSGGESSEVEVGGDG